MRARLLSTALLFGLAQGCAQRAGPVSRLPCTLPDAGPQVPVSQPGAREGTLTWRLSLLEAPAQSLSTTELHPFTVGRWECALGQEQTEAHERLRRLACTHETGATLQTELACAAAPHGPAERPLLLTLDTSATLRLWCEREPSPTALAPAPRD